MTNRESPFSLAPLRAAGYEWLLTAEDPDAVVRSLAEAVEAARIYAAHEQAEPEITDPSYDDWSIGLYRHEQVLHDALARFSE